MAVARGEYSYLYEGHRREMASEGRKQPGALKSFIAGGAGGSCLVLTGHPLDTIKVKGGEGGGILLA